MKYTFFSILALVLFPLSAMAQGVTLNSILEGFGGFMLLLFPFILGLSLVAFLWGMVLFIFNAGSEEGRGQGKKVMIWGVIALTATVGLWGIVSIVLVTFDLDSSKTCPPPQINGSSYSTC